MNQKVQIEYFDRASKSYQKEIVFADGFMYFAYENELGFFLTQHIFSKSFFSSLYGAFKNSHYSAKSIASFAANLKIDIGEAEKPLDEYKTFNEFFSRKLQPKSRPVASAPYLASPCDARVLGYQILQDEYIFTIKEQQFSINTLIGDITFASHYKNASMYIFRLCPSDYHRFHFPDDGIPSETKIINGEYHSVNPVALKHVDSFSRNKRTLTVFHSQLFGDILYIEVGALGVGSIQQTYAANKTIKRGDEKGYFQFGGSTVILLLKSGMIQIDNDILEHTKKGIETRLLMGSRIGKAL